MQAPLQARNDADTQTDTARTIAQKRVLADNRPDAVAQCKLAEMMNNSPRVLQQRALSDAIHNSPRMVAQRHEMSALFGGVVQKQDGGATLAEIAPVQREEKANNTGLPDQLKSGIESLSGMSMDHVKVHYNSEKPAQLQAHAYAQGSEIHVAPGQEGHLPHEAWHIVQQAQGRVRPTVQMKAAAINDEPSLEAEADIMGRKAAQFHTDHDVSNLATEGRVGGTITPRNNGFAVKHVAQLASQKQIKAATSEYFLIKQRLDNEDRTLEEFVADLGDLARHVGSIRDDTDYEVKKVGKDTVYVGGFTTIFNYTDRLFEKLSARFGMAKLEPAIELLNLIQDVLKAATAKLLAQGGAKSLPELEVPAYSGAGVNAKAWASVYLKSASSASSASAASAASAGEPYESALMSNGPYNEGQARYYNRFATVPEAGGDAEVKAVSDLTAEFKRYFGKAYTNNPADLYGTALLQINLGPCKSCREVISKFNKDHPNVELVVRYRQDSAQMSNAGNAKVGGMLGYSDATPADKYLEKRLG